MKQEFEKKFEDLVKKIFENKQYETSVVRIDWHFSVIVVKNGFTLYVDSKFYRSRLVQVNNIKTAARNLARYVNSNNRASNKTKGILAVNNFIIQSVRDSIYEEFGIEIWDGNIIYHRLSEISLELSEEFEKLILEAQQGTTSINNLSWLKEDKNEKPKEGSVKKIDISTPKQSIGDKLIEELEKLDCGRDNWSKFEKLGLKILKHLFDNDLSLWSKQARTDDKLSRFDLICRIASKDDFWNALVHSYNTRFVLFEFKNYCNKINQGQIYTTERYLFIKALRSVGFVLARKGGGLNAINAAKGALKENGKLILILDDEDLKQMIRLKEVGSSPNDYLSEILDNWLVSLSR